MGMALVIFAFMTLAVLTTEAAAQVTGLTITPNPAQVGSVVTITVNATACMDVEVDLGEGTPIHLFSSGGWPQSVQHTYGLPVGGTTWTRYIGASGKWPATCLNQLSASLTLVPAFTLLQGDVFGLLCQIVSTGVCSSPAPPPPSPTITSVSGCFEPGCYVFVRGTNFGTTYYGATGAGKLLLKGNFPGGSLDLKANPYTEDYVMGQIPYVTGVLDQNALLQVVTAKQVASNAVDAYFRATRDIIPVPASAVGVSCSNAAGLDMCSPLPPLSFFGFHQDLNSTCNWASTKFGNDQYDLNLKNGWRPHLMNTTDVRTNVSQSHVPSGAQTSFKVGWHTQHLCWIGYHVRFSIIGPKGVPVQ